MSAPAASWCDPAGDRAYFNSTEILACHEAGIKVTLPKPQTSNAKSEERFGKQDFVYCQSRTPIAVRLGERLPYRYANEEDGKMLRRYWTTASQTCALNSQCTPGPERRITRWEHEHLLDAVQQRLDANVTEVRRTPSISAKNSCVKLMVSPPARSAVCRSHRQKRASTT